MAAACEHTQASNSASGNVEGGEATGGSSCGSAPSPESVLAEWVADNADDPVPSFAEKRHLASKTGLSVKAVSEWFSRLKADTKASQAEQRMADEASAAEALKGLDMDEKRKAMAEKLARSLGGFASGGADMQFDAARFRNMSEY